VNMGGRRGEGSGCVGQYGPAGVGLSEMNNGVF
jgi:hypothetical protein